MRTEYNYLKQLLNLSIEILNNETTSAETKQQAYANFLFCSNKLLAEIEKLPEIKLTA